MMLALSRHLGLCTQMGWTKVGPGVSVAFGTEDRTNHTTPSVESHRWPCHYTEKSALGTSESQQDEPFRQRPRNFNQQSPMA